MRCYHLFVLLVAVVLLTGCFTEPGEEFAFEERLRDQILRRKILLEELRKEAGAQTELSFEEFRERYVSEGEKVFLRLDDALELAMQNNLGLKVASFGPRIAEENYLASFGTFDPAVFGTVGFEDRLEPQPSRLFGTETSSEDTGNYSLGMRKVWQTGTVTEATFGNSRFRSNSQVFDPNPFYQATESIDISQPLLRNGWPDFVLAEVRSTRVLRRQAMDDLLATEVATLAEVRRAYWRLVVAFENLRANEQSLELAKQFLDDVKKKLDVGAVAELEKTRAESEVASRREAVILSRTEIRDAQDALRLLIDPENNLVADIDLRPVDRAEFVEPKISRLDAIRVALTMRPDLMSLRKSIRAQNIAIVRAQNQTLPIVDLVGTFATNGLSSAPGEAIDRASALQDITYAGSLQFEYPLGNRRAKHELKREKLSKQQLVRQLHQAEYRALEGVKRSYRGVTTAAKRIVTTREALRFARERLKGEDAKYKEGAATYLDVFQAQRDLTTAEVNLNRAIVDYRIALANLSEAMGLPFYSPTEKLPDTIALPPLKPKSIEPPDRTGENGILEGENGQDGEE